MIPTIWYAVREVNLWLQHNVFGVLFQMKPYELAMFLGMFVILCIGVYYRLRYERDAIIEDTIRDMNKHLLSSYEATGYGPKRLTPREEQSVREMLGQKDYFELLAYLWRLTPDKIDTGSGDSSNKREGQDHL